MFIPTGDTVAFLESGVHTYWCTPDNTGAITVVETSHTIALCEDCSGTDLLVRTGEVVYWTIGSSDPVYQNCIVQLVSLNCSTVVREFDSTEQGMWTSSSHTCKCAHIHKYACMHARTTHTYSNVKNASWEANIISPEFPSFWKFEKNHLKQGQNPALVSLYVDLDTNK